MESIQVSNPYLRNAPSCRRFQSSIRLSINWSVRMLFAIATVVAEVLTLHAYSQGRDHNFIVDLANADIRRCCMNRRRFIIKSGTQVFNIFCNNNEDANVWELVVAHSSSRRFADFYRLGEQIADGRHSKVYLAHAKNGRSTKYIVKVNNRVAECNGFIFRSQYERDAHLQLLADFDARRQRHPGEKEIDLEEKMHRKRKLDLSLEKIVTLRDSFGTITEDFLVFTFQDGEILSTAISKNPGRQQYKALEILSGQYHGKPADIWSSGVLLYQMLSGSLPFQGETGREVCENINDSLLFNSLFAAPVWDTVSPNAILLIKQMLQPDPFKRPSALGARSHEWLCDEKVCRQHREEISRHGKQTQVPDRLQTPTAGRLTRASSAYDPSMLPAPFHAEQHDEELREHKLRMTDKQQSEVVSSGNDHPPRREQTGARNSSCSAEDTVRAAVAGDRDGSENGSRRLGCSGKRTFPFVSSITRTLRSDRLGKMTSAVSDKLTKLQATFNFKNRNQVASEDILNTSSDLDLPYTQSAKQEDSEGGSETEELTKIASEYSGKTRFPDRERISLERFPTREFHTADLGHSTLPLRLPHALTHRCNHLFSHRPCTRSVLMARTDKLLKSRTGSKFRRSVKPNSFKLEFASYSPVLTPDGKIQPTSGAPDRALRFRQQQRVGSSSEIMPIIRCLDDDVFQWALKTRLFSDLELRLAPLDPLFYRRALSTTRDARTKENEFSNPLFYCRGSSSTDRDASGKEKDLLPLPSHYWKHSTLPVPLRDEMCITTPIMQSVVAAAHVGLSQFTQSRPTVAKLLLGSPTAQLHLSMILPYRRKLRTAALALVAMLRMISLKKRSCLTRRVSRGQSLPEKLLTRLTDTSRNYNMTPLRARMPKMLPSDKYTDDPISLKERVEPRPRISTTQQRFWSRQIEVKKGILVNAWRFAKDRVKKVATAVVHGRSHEDTNRSQYDECNIDRPGEHDEGVDASVESNVFNEAGRPRRWWRYRRLQRCSWCHFRRLIAPVD